MTKKDDDNTKNEWVDFDMIKVKTRKYPCFIIIIDIYLFEKIMGIGER